MSINKSSLTIAGVNPQAWLTNISVAYFQDNNDFIATKIFPILPVDISTGNYPIFSKEDLNRDNFQRKPEGGKVNPTIISQTKGTYDCDVDQIIMSIDKFQATNNSRNGLGGMANLQIAKAKTIAYQALLHLDNLFAKKYFQPGVWGNEMQGVDSGEDNTTTFLKFSNANSEPIQFIRTLSREFRRTTTRKPNIMLCGVEAFDALTQHPDIIERVIHGGSSTNPAQADERVLAELFGVDRVVVMESTVNAAQYGLDEDMKYICDPKGILLAHVTSTPHIDEPTAGYIYAWDPSGNRQPITIQTFDGDPASHTEFVEGIIAFDMHIACPDLGVYLSEVV